MHWSLEELPGMIVCQMKSSARMDRGFDNSDTSRREDKEERSVR